jgi:hypothetical protein
MFSIAIFVTVEQLQQIFPDSDQLAYLTNTATAGENLHLPRPVSLRIIGNKWRNKGSLYTRLLTVRYIIKPLAIVN